MASDNVRIFKFYLKNSRNIFDIMASACKALEPFETEMVLEKDDVLRGAVYRFAEATNKIRALEYLKEDLLIFCNQRIMEKVGRKKFFYLLQLIDGKCMDAVDNSLPDSYIHCSSLNTILTDSIVILPKARNGMMTKLSETIAEDEKSKKGAGFFGRNYSETASVSGYLSNFIIYHKNGDLKPVLHIPKYTEDIKAKFIQNGYRLRIAVFPLSAESLYALFNIKEIVSEKKGIFSIISAFSGTEEKIVDWCKKALLLCREKKIDIAVFPEMLFTEDSWGKICGFMREEYEEERRFPFFIWFGTAWRNRMNECLVADQYGTEIFRQRKFVPYAYKNVSEKPGNPKQRIEYKEDLAREKNITINFLDMSNLLRICTAICKDIASADLKGLIGDLSSDMVIIPAFSASDRLTERHVKPLVLERVAAVVCNACSSQCVDKHDRFLVTDKMIGKQLPFAYLYMPAKELNDNSGVVSRIEYDTRCRTCCTEGCPGRMFEVSFLEYTKKDGKYTAQIMTI